MSQIKARFAVSFSVFSLFATCASYAQQPAGAIGAPDNIPTSLVQAQVAPMGMPVGAPGLPPGTAVPVLGNKSVGTLQRIEMIMREQAEADARGKALGGLQGMPIPGFMGGLPGMPGVGSLMEPSAAMNAMPHAIMHKKNQVAEESGLEKSNRELANYNTVSVTIFDGTAMADVMHNGELNAVRVGDKVGEKEPFWLVKKISMKGVYVEREEQGKASKGKPAVVKYYSAMIKPTEMSRMPDSMSSKFESGMMSSGSIPAANFTLPPRVGTADSTGIRLPNMP